MKQLTKKYINPHPEHFRELVRKVTNYDLAAANWLMNEAPKQKDFVYSAYLNQCFLWEKSPQGFIFWKNLNKKIHY